LVEAQNNFITVYIADVHVHIQRIVSVVKVATMLEACTTEKQHSVLHFLWAKGLNARISTKICLLFKVGSAVA
jgi:hypothetical protein